MKIPNFKRLHCIHWIKLVHVWIVYGLLWLTATKISRKEIARGLVKCKSNVEIPSFKDIQEQIDTSKAIDDLYDYVKRIYEDSFVRLRDANENARGLLLLATLSVALSSYLNGLCPSSWMAGPILITLATVYLLLCAFGELKIWATDFGAELLPSTGDRKHSMAVDMYKCAVANDCVLPVGVKNL